MQNYLRRGGPVRTPDPKQLVDPAEGTDRGGRLRDWGPTPLPETWRAFRPKAHLKVVTFYRRRLPHIYQTQNPLFLTWRLYNSLPRNRLFPGGTLSSGEAFVAMDHLLDKAQDGPRYLSQPEIADLVVEAIHFNAEGLSQYELHAFVVMPNHVHLLITPKIPVPHLTKSLKGITAKRANELLAQTGNPFWQRESYDHAARNETEFGGIRRYIENNPVRAGLAQQPSEYKWSSAASLP